MYFYFHTHSGNLYCNLGIFRFFRMGEISMKANRDGMFTTKRSGLRNLIFPGCVLVIYGIVFVINPAGAARAFGSSTGILRSLMIPLSLVFTLMVLMNLFLKPAHIVRLLGQESGCRGVTLSAAAGIISMGPIFMPGTLCLRNCGEKEQRIH